LPFSRWKFDSGENATYGFLASLLGSLISKQLVSGIAGRQVAAMNALLRFLRDDDAATAVEYAVMLALILLVAISSISALGSQSGGMWGGIDNDLTAAGLGN
jgi:pilus assembly protein Flp/PilA